MIVCTPYQQNCKIEVDSTMKSGHLSLGFFNAANEKLLETLKRP